MSATRFLRNDDGLFLEYEPIANVDWVRTRLDEDGEFTLRRALTFEKDDIIGWPDANDYAETYTIRMGSFEGGYYRVPGRVLGADHDLYIGRECQVAMKWFSVQNVSVFGHVFKVVDEDVRIGGSDPVAMTEEEFQVLVDRFPWSQTEMRLYADSRIASAVESHFSVREDFGAHYQAYMGRSASRAVRLTGEVMGFDESFDHARAALYSDALARLEAMVYGNARETDFQRVLPPYLELLFPQYIAFLGQKAIPDLGGGTRKPDYLMVDVRGNVDVLEIKRPFDNEVMLRRAKYRDIGVPGTELSGAVVQCRRYADCLLNGGGRLADRLTLRFAQDGLIPEGLQLRFISPKGIVIMGRDVEEDRALDFDVIRRQYADVVDVITYDDLIRRFQRTVNAVKAGPSRWRTTSEDKE